MAPRRPSKKQTGEAWDTLRELLIQFPTPRKRTMTKDKFEWDTPRPPDPPVPSSFYPNQPQEARLKAWASFGVREYWNQPHEEWRAHGREVSAWRSTWRLIEKAHPEYGTLNPQNLLAPLLVAVGRDQLGNVPLFAINQVIPEEEVQIGAGCSLFTECVSIIVQDCEPLVWRPRPRTQFDRDLDRMLIDQETLEVRDNKIIVIDRPDANQINLLATTWRDPNYQHQPYWRRGVITLTAAQLRMQERTFFITGRNLKPMAEKFDATHRMYFSSLRWDDGPTPYTKSRTQLKEWVMTERDRLYDAALVMLKDGWLGRNMSWSWS